MGYLPDDCKANETGICKWAVSDIDYPDGGAYGFKFTLPDQFDYDVAVNLDDSVKCLTEKDRDFNVKFTQAEPDIAGTCYHKPSDPQLCP